MNTLYWSSADSSFSEAEAPDDAGLSDFEDSGNVSSDDVSGKEEAEDGGGERLPESTCFTRPQAIEGPPREFLQNPNFYKSVLSGEGDISQKIHTNFSSFIKSTDSQERGQFRGRLIPAYWELLASLAGNIMRLTEEKLVFFRYSLLLPSALAPEQKDMMTKVIWENTSGEPIYYMDEWLKALAKGDVSASAQDEVKVSHRDDTQKIRGLLDRAKGKFEAQEGLIRGAANEMKDLEHKLLDLCQGLQKHETRRGSSGLIMPYTEGQRAQMSQINETLRRLATLTKDLGRYHGEMNEIEKTLEVLHNKEKEAGVESAVDNKVIVAELNSLRQMNKMCVGRQGNAFPFMLKQYVRTNIRDICTRENIINILADLEHLDPGLFQRSFKQQTNRIVPNIIILPCYGDAGICWEPFERFNRATSRGRVAMPLYPKDARLAIISAMADYRWQAAKEKAAHYWMEEGLTGWYYQWFSERKMKGDVRESFIQDYILWISKESEGMQKLDKDARGVFWRYVPFPQDVKDKLKTRGFVYAELYKKDQNRAMSDGY
ncbi:MAG: hypothetical protein LBC67_02225 [Spirochaetales bacterium]|jgi:hypothetical protein|nr:hypothetical protein [Spirochaetales bacterium]